MLEVEFTNRLLFTLTDKTDELEIDLSNYDNQKVFIKKLPTQMMIGEQLDKFKSNINTSTNSMQAMVFGNFLLSTLVSFSLSYLWGMINCL